MDFNAKQAFLDLQPTNLPRQRAFLLESVCIFAGLWKITADMGPQVRYLAHQKLARQKFHQMHILDAHVFDLVDWEMAHKTLHNVPIVPAMGMQADDGNCGNNGMGQYGMPEMSKLYVGTRHVRASPALQLCWTF
jgi:hypothetical protein